MKTLHLVALAGLSLGALAAARCQPDPPVTCPDRACGPVPPVPPCPPMQMRTAPLTCEPVAEGCAWRIGPCALPDGGAR
jgi:hypothetical protein